MGVDLAASLEDDYLDSHDDGGDDMMGSDDFGDDELDDRESLLDEFCKRMGIDRDSLEAFLEDQAAAGGVEGDHFDRYGEEVIDPEDGVEH